MNLDNIVEKLVKDFKYSLYQLTVLKILINEGPLHGYAIKKRIEEISSGRLRPSESTIYDILKRLERMGLIESYWCANPLGGPLRKCYRAKEHAREVLEETLKELSLILEVLLRE